MAAEAPGTASVALRVLPRHDARLGSASDPAATVSDRDATAEIAFWKVGDSGLALPSVLFRRTAHFVISLDLLLCTYPRLGISISSLFLLVALFATFPDMPPPSLIATPTRNKPWMSRRLVI